MEVPGLCATWVSLVHSFKVQDGRVICGGMFLFSLTRFFWNIHPFHQFSAIPRRPLEGSGPSPLFPVALKDPMHLCTSCCTVPRATAAWAFPDCLPHPEARKPREHRLPQCSLVGNQKEWQAEGGVGIVVLQMRGGVGWGNQAMERGRRCN